MKKTGAMNDIYTIATKVEFLKAMLEIDVPEFEPIYQARPGMYLPILIRENNQSKMVMAKWGANIKSQPTNYVKMDRILKQKPYNQLIRSNRCSIPANCFITKSKNKVWLVKLIKQRLFWMGGVYQKSISKQGKELYQFAILLTDQADVLSSICSEMPVLMGMDRHQHWIEPKDIAGIMNMADKSSKQWFDFFEVNINILSPSINQKEILIPLGSTYQQYQQRQKKFEKIKIDELRANSRGRK